MAGIFKTLIRVGVITAASAGVAVLIAGPHRAAALVSQARESIMTHIDDSIEDPVALRSQLRELEREYPGKISQVRGDLAELRAQSKQLERDRAVSERVVALADRDLGVIRPLLEEADSAQAQKASYGDIRNVVSVRFDNHTYTLDQARSKANQIAHTRVAYANRAADAAHDLVYLAQQEERLDELLTQLESERAQFQSQLWQLDRQVDAIARNEKLIDMLEKRKKTIEECSRYEVASLDHIVSKLAEVRARQQAELDVLTGQDAAVDYEEIARMQIGTEDGVIRSAPMAEDTSAQGLLYMTDETLLPKRR
jgi:chromosome segregation ATPase